MSALYVKENLQAKSTKSLIYQIPIRQRFKTGFKHKKYVAFSYCSSWCCIPEYD